MDNAKITAHFPLLHDQWLLRVYYPELVATALPGHNLVIDGVEIAIAWIKHASNELEFYYTRTRDHKLRRLSDKQTVAVELTGKPITFTNPEKPYIVVADAPGFAAAQAFIAHQTKTDQPPTLSLLAIANTFPFRPRPSRFLVSGLPDHVIAAHPLCEEWGVASRLAAAEEANGCYEGTVHDLLAAYLRHSAQIPQRVLAIGSPELLANIAQHADDLAQFDHHLVLA